MIAALGDTAKSKREPAAEPRTARSARQARPGTRACPLAAPADGDDRHLGGMLRVTLRSQHSPRARRTLPPLRAGVGLSRIMAFAKQIRAFCAIGRAARLPTSSRAYFRYREPHVPRKAARCARLAWFR